MKIIETVDEMQTAADSLRRAGIRIGLVPTMGALHDGHLSLVAEARKLSDTVVMSIYVNPTQFGRGEDFGKYPRNLGADRKLAENKGVDYLFTPSDAEMYPDDHLAFIEVERVSRVLEGEFRPTHFKGVATVVAKLFNIVKPHVAVFGQKDAQQAFVIRKMVHDLNFDIEIVAAPIIREKDGLAMSSRNVYLSKQGRAEATVLYKSLKFAEEAVLSGETNFDEIRSKMLNLITGTSSGVADYIRFVNPATFEEVGGPGQLKQVLGLVAVRFGKTRLIDNLILNRDES